jgi:hypothetical protein
MRANEDSGRWFLSSCMKLIDMKEEIEDDEKRKYDQNNPPEFRNR